jgi:hypothetical protein
MLRGLRLPCLRIFIIDEPRPDDPDKLFLRLRGNQDQKAEVSEGFRVNQRPARRGKGSAKRSDRAGGVDRTLALLGQSLLLLCGKERNQLRKDLISLRSPVEHAGVCSLNERSERFFLLLGSHAPDLIDQVLWRSKKYQLIWQAMLRLATDTTE